LQNGLAKLTAAENCCILYSGEVVLKSLWALPLKALDTSCWLEKIKEYQESAPDKTYHFVILGLNDLFIFSHTSQKVYCWEGSGEKQ